AIQLADIAAFRTEDSGDPLEYRKVGILEHIVTGDRSPPRVPLVPWPEFADGMDVSGRLRIGQHAFEAKWPMHTGGGQLQFRQVVLERFLAAVFGEYAEYGPVRDHLTNFEIVSAVSVVPIRTGRPFLFV